jgi:hypothetical protein
MFVDQKNLTKKIRLAYRRLSGEISVHHHRRRGEAEEAMVRGVDVRSLTKRKTTQATFPITIFGLATISWVLRPEMRYRTPRCTKTSTSRMILQRTSFGMKHLVRVDQVMKMVVAKTV